MFKFKIGRLAFYGGTMDFAHDCAKWYIGVAWYPGKKLRELEQPPHIEITFWRGPPMEAIESGARWVRPGLWEIPRSSFEPPLVEYHRDPWWKFWDGSWRVIHNG